MRYLGNKESLKEIIRDFMQKKGLLDNTPVFFDAFCGTGTVSDSIKDSVKIIINDNMKLATAFACGRILKNELLFNSLGFNPIDYFNSNEKSLKGFCSNNYAPELSGRMYFSDYNAGRIDYFRNEIEEWFKNKLIDENEYYYLLGCLLESVSKVANVAGVYGSYLKKWDPRANKKIKFLEIESSNLNFKKEDLLSVYNTNIESIIEDVDCDILYLDPPYTKNKYTVQYHLLETLVRNDIPELFGKTGCRHYEDTSDEWSKNNSVHIALDKVIAKTKAKHILLSYSSDGIMSKDYIISVMKRYGKEETFSLLEIPYKKYRNYKTTNDDEHFEYLFYIEKKPADQVIYTCPLNYMGGKSNVISKMKSAISSEKNLVFVDLMSGGFNVGINAYGYEKYYCNDINYIVVDLLKYFKEHDTLYILQKIEQLIKKYGLEKHNKNKFVLYRAKYNNEFRFRDDYEIYLYTLILYGFQQQIRFNSKYEFNNTVGESGYSDSIKEKIVSFSRRIKEMDVEFSCKDFTSFNGVIDEKTTLYVDPPYLITLGSYNDGKRGFNGWNDSHEYELMNFIDSVKISGCKIVLSNILEYKGKENLILKQWVNDNEPTVETIKCRARNEVLITYESSF